MPLRTIFTFLLLLLPLFNSVVSQQLTQLIPQGELPDEIKSTFVPFALVERSAKNNPVRLSSELDYHRSVNYLLSSALVVYGTPEIKYAQSILDRIVTANGMKEKTEFYMFRSSLFRSFQTSNGSVVLTTGLLAQISSEGQIAYFIARELAIKNLGFKEWEVKLIKSIKNYDDVLNLLWERSLGREKQIDQEALRILTKAGYGLTDLVAGLIAYNYSDFPFEDLFVNEEDFSNQFALFPSRYFDRNMIVAATVEPNAELEIKVRARIEAVGGKFENNSNSMNDQSFNEMQSSCRVENILMRIINGDHLSAIYESMILKKQNPSIILYSKLEALAWLGQLQFLNFKYKPLIKSTPFLSFSKSASFFNFIKLMNSEALTVICLRKLNDMNTQFPNEQFFATVFENALMITRDSKHFNPSDFRSKSEQFAKQLAEFNRKNSDIDKISSLEGEKNSLKEKDYDQFFYLMLIPDILESGLFELKSEKSNSRHYSNSLSFNFFKGKTFSEKKTKESKTKLDNLGTDLKTYSITDDYINHYIFNTTLMQAFNNVESGQGFLPYSFEIIKQKNNTTNVAYNMFKERRGMYFKPSYYVGLTGIGLVYVLPEMLLNRSRSVQTYFNTNDQGCIISYHQFHFKEPLTKLQIKGRMYYSNNFKEYD
jgi:hypothetical protein